MVILTYVTTRPVLGILLLAGLCGPASVSARQAAQEERPYVEEVKRDFLEKLEKCAADRDWRRLFEHYSQALQRYGNFLVLLEKDRLGQERWTSVREYLVARFSKLPPEAFAAYRFEKDGPARAAFEKARDSGSRIQLERAAEEYFFSSAADDVIDALARQAFDEGRAFEAALHWGRLLRYHPDTDFPKAATAARLAVALRAAGSDSGLAALKAWVIEKGVQGRVLQGGREVELSSLLDAPPGPAPGTAAPLVAPRLPETPGPELQGRARTRGVTNEIRRWSYELARELVSEPAQPSAPGVRVVIQPGLEAAPVQMPGDHPVLPAGARLQGRDYVLVSDGSRVLAFDPGRVKGSSATAGMYWKYPPDRAVSRTLPSPQNPNLMPMPRAAVGLTVSGDRVFAPMRSRLEVRPRDGTPPNDSFDGPTSIKCLHIPTGRLIWDTDLKPLIDELQSVGGKFAERNFAYCGAPLVSGDRVFIPVCSSPAGEQESWVLCLDARSGRPLWSTLLATIPSMQGMWGQGRPTLYQTTLVAAEGLLFVQSNLGVTGALHPTTGTLQWLSRYRRVGRKQSNMGNLEPSFFRAPGAPIVWNGTLYVLPQDCVELLAFEASSGRRVELPAPKAAQGDFDWRGANYLLGPVEDSLVVAGSPTSYVLRLRTFRALSLSISNTRGMGRGVLQGGFLHLPVQPPADRGTTGSLVIFDERTWKLVMDAPWRDAGDGGNLLIAGDSLVSSGRRLCVYGSLANVREQYRRRLEQTPPQGPVLLEYGDLMLENGRLDEAAEAYEKFIAAAAGHPGLDARVRQVKSDLYGIFLRRGREALVRNDPARAAEAYAYARSFAWDDLGELEAMAERAKALEKLERWEEAAAAHQEILEHGGPLFVREADRISRAAELSHQRLIEIKAAHPEACAGLERRAGEALAAADSEERLRALMDRFPRSQAAREAFGRLRAQLQDPGALAVLCSEFSLRFGEEPDRALLLQAADAADRAGERSGFERSLAELERRFGAEQTGPEGREEPISEFVKRRRAERVWPVTPEAPSGGKLRKAASLGTGTDLPLTPLAPEGAPPASLAASRELFSSGSALELWDLEQSRRLAAWPKPGASLGCQVEEVEGGLRVGQVQPGSPAERAGIRAGDLLTGAEGRPLKKSRLDDLLGSRAPGRKLSFNVLRDGAEIRVEAEPGACPAEEGDPAIDAAYTPSGALAVAWKDAVSVIDLRSSKVRWTFRPARARFEIQWMKCAGDVLYVFEAAPPEALRKGVWTPEEAHHRLYCLSAVSGAVVWGRALDFDPQQATLEVSLKFAGSGGGDAGILVLQVSRPGGSPTFELWTASGAGGVQRRPLQGNVLDFVWEPVKGFLYYVGDQPERRERTLHGVALTGGKDVAKPLQSEALMPSRYTTAALTATADWVALALPPPQAEEKPRLLAWRLPDFEERRLALPEGRTLAPNWKGGVVAGSGGEWLVFNQKRDPGLQGGASSHLSAFRPGGPAADAFVWDAPAPSTAISPHVAGFRLEGSSSGHAVLTISRGSIPGLVRDGPVVAVYDLPAEGLIRLRGLSPAPQGGADLPPAGAVRGRICVRTPAGLDVYVRE